MSKHRTLLVMIIILGLIGCTMPGVNRLPETDTSQATLSAVPSALPSKVPANHTLTVFAAASLTGAFQEIGKDYETANPGVNVSFNFAGSQILRVQIEQGAKADVFASADRKNMDVVAADNLVNVNSIRDFVTNTLVVILAPGNPGEVKTLTDLARPKLKLILADSSVPAGNYARQIISNLGKDPASGANFNTEVLANVVSNETDVKQVVTKVELGEADAGIVYHSDAVASPHLVTITIPEKFNIIAHYPIAILTNAPEPQFAEAFITYIMSPAGQSIMIKWGFSPVVQ
jgi:molybdate transport system substrate-binding protein